MPRRRPRTRLHMLADAITALDQATACLHEIDLRSTNAEMRSELKEARGLAGQACKQAQLVYQKAIVEVGPRTPVT